MTRLADFTTNTYSGIAPVCSRASGGYAETVSGQLTWFGNDTLRCTDKGLLVEPAATNLALRSSHLETSPWVPENFNNYQQLYGYYPWYGGTNPDGSTDGTILHYAQVYADGYYSWAMWWQRNIPANVGDALTYSVWLRNASGGDREINLSDVNCLYQNGDKVKMSSTWTRFSKTFTTNRTSNDMMIGYYDGDTISQTGDVDAAAWGAQVELGSKATSYFPSGDTAATRAADAVSFIVPSGVSTLTYTFDDDSTQTAAVTPGSTYTIPGTLNRQTIKYIDAVPTTQGTTYTITAEPASMSIGAAQARITRLARVIAESSASAIGASPAKLTRSAKLVVAPATVAATAAPAAVKRRATVIAAPAQANITAPAVAVKRSTTVIATASAATITAPPASVRQASKVRADTSNSTLLAAPVRVSALRTIRAVPASATLSAPPVSLTAYRQVRASSATLTSTFEVVSLRAVRRLIAQPAGLIADGLAAQVLAAHFLRCATDTLMVTGSPVQPTTARLLLCSTANIALVFSETGVIAVAAPLRIPVPQRMLTLGNVGSNTAKMVGAGTRGIILQAGGGKAMDTVTGSRASMNLSDPDNSGLIALF